MDFNKLAWLAFSVPSQWVSKWFPVNPLIHYNHKKSAYILNRMLWWDINN